MDAAQLRACLQRNLCTTRRPLDACVCRSLWLDYKSPGLATEWRLAGIAAAEILDRQLLLSPVRANV